MTNCSSSLLVFASSLHVWKIDISLAAKDYKCSPHPFTFFFLSPSIIAFPSHHCLPILSSPSLLILSLRPYFIFFMTIPISYLTLNKNNSLPIFIIGQPPSHEEVTGPDWHTLGWMENHPGNLGFGKEQDIREEAYEREDHGQGLSSTGLQGHTEGSGALSSWGKKTHQK